MSSRRHSANREGQGLKATAGDCLGSRGDWPSKQPYAQSALEGPGASRGHPRSQVCQERVESELRPRTVIGHCVQAPPHAPADLPQLPCKAPGRPPSPAPTWPSGRAAIFLCLDFPFPPSCLPRTQQRGASPRKGGGKPREGGCSLGHTPRTARPWSPLLPFSTKQDP